MKGLLTLALLASGWSTQAQTAVSRDTVMMGVSFTFTAVHEVPDSAWLALDAGMQEVARIEAWMSSWNPDSQTSAINAAAGGEPVKVNPELCQLIARSKKISALSGGHFDLSFASIHKVWDFIAFTQETLPSEAEIAASVALIDHTQIEVDLERSTVRLAQPGMRIGFGAIGKGYAANRAKAVMVAAGAESGVVNAGGDLLAWGSKPQGGAWQVGIADPHSDTGVLAWIDATDMAVVTSGNYKKFITIDGERYCHIVNPHTGWPVQHLTSVTVVCPDAELADALATTVFVLGPEEGLALINHLDGVECAVVDGSGTLLLSHGMNPQLAARE